jgi:hypothetical protein
MDGISPTHFAIQTRVGISPNSYQHSRGRDLLQIVLSRRIELLLCRVVAAISSFIKLQSPGHERWSVLTTFPSCRRKVFKTEHLLRPKCSKKTTWPITPRSISNVLLAAPCQEKSASTWSDISVLRLTLSASGSPRITARSVLPAEERVRRQSCVG